MNKKLSLFMRALLLCVLFTWSEHPECVSVRIRELLQLFWSICKIEVLSHGAFQSFCLIWGISAWLEFNQNYRSVRPFLFPMGNALLEWHRLKYRRSHQVFIHTHCAAALFTRETIWQIYLKFFDYFKDVFLLIRCVTILMYICCLVF